MSFKNGTPVTSRAGKSSGKDKPANAPTTTLGITVKKEDDFSSWYQQVLQRSECIDYYDVSGCYVLRPWSFYIWTRVQKFIGKMIKEMNVQDAYYPTFVTEKRLESEKTHIEGFSPEVAWVTRSGNSELAEPIALRPTSETIICPYYASWVRSHRDLPLKTNQWCNVVRWEFKHPLPFLRTREFLWQEGHCIYATKEECHQDVVKTLEIYRKTFEELMAVPVIPGIKSENEKFCGADYTYTVEGFVKETGRGLQGATSHFLGQRFSKLFEIMFENESKERMYAWQNSWGFSTRSIGLMIMVHSDNKGLVLPPRVAMVQVVIVPVGLQSKTPTEVRDKITSKATQISDKLNAVKIRAQADTKTSVTVGWKFSYWELKGVPLRIELGPKEMEKNEVKVVLRHNSSSIVLPIDQLEEKLPKVMEEVHESMLNKAKAVIEESLKTHDNWEDFITSLNNKCIIQTPWCEDPECEDKVKEKSSKTKEPQTDDKSPSMGAKVLCLPFNQPGSCSGKKCFSCNKDATKYAIWGRSY